MTESETSPQVVFSDEIPKPRFYLFKIDLNWKEMIAEFGILEVFWGYDIWFGRIPFIKTLLLANVIVWILAN